MPSGLLPALVVALRVRELVLHGLLVLKAETLEHGDPGVFLARDVRDCELRAATEKVCGEAGSKSTARWKSHA